MRYKRYRRYRRARSTNVIRMKFQSFMDINTSASSMQIITISAGGKEIVKRLAPQFGAYKYYRIGRISAKLVPASTLPVDPTGLSYEAGETTVDPRDQLTPGMMRITNGEDIFEDISGLSSDVQHAIYNNMLLDPRWFKWMLQSGVKRHAYPRYWQIGQLHQDKWPGMTVNFPKFNEAGTSIVGTDTAQRIGQIGVSDNVYSTSGNPGSDSRGFFQTGHRGTLGWLPTDGLQSVATPSESGASVDYPFIASPPEVEVMKIILPKAYKTEYYYRLFITEEVLFREPIVTMGITVNDAVYQPLDIFHSVPRAVPHSPATGSTGTGVADYPLDTYTGGNYGDN